MDSGNMHGESSGWYDYNADASVTVNLICAQWTDNKVNSVIRLLSLYHDSIADYYKYRVYFSQ